MPFREHRGSGITGRTIHDMCGIWNAEWSGKSADWEHCGNSINWVNIHRYICPQGNILEAGCGIGKWVKFFNEQGFEAYGIDFAAVGIEKAINKWPELNNRLTVGDLREMPYDNNYFDTVVSFGAIEHNEGGIEEPLKEMVRVLKPGGFIYCTVPCMNRFRKIGFMALQDWIVRNRTIRHLTGRKTEYAFYEYVFYRREYETILKKMGLDLLVMIPLEPITTFGDYGSIPYRILHFIDRLFPWTFTHMMAAVCRKPN